MWDALPKLLWHFSQGPSEAPRACTSIVSALLEGAPEAPSQGASEGLRGRPE